MKTPDEIKKKIKCFLKSCVGTCNMICGTCEVYEAGYSLSAACSDALAYIQQLESDLQKERIQHQYTIDAANVMKDEALKFESRLAQAERERDAAVESLRGECFECLWHESMCDKCASCVHCADAWNVNEDNWQWCGVRPEKTKEENE